MVEKMCGNKLRYEIKIITINQTAVIVLCHWENKFFYVKKIHFCYCTMLSLLLCAMKLKEIMLSG